MRKRRRYSENGLYHVVIRGVNKQNIFLDDNDREFFISLLHKYGKKYGISFHSHTLMDNHAHFLLRDRNHNLSAFIQVVTSVYARFFNKKYDRVGHLFQSRFLSEVIEDIKYYLTVFRYILQNPEKAGICRASQYIWSSYSYYKKKKSLVDVEDILRIFETREKLYKFIEKQGDSECLDIELRPSEKEEYRINKIKKLLHSSSTLIPPDLPKDELKNKLRLLKNSGLSVRVISRLTGIMNSVVARA